MEGSSKMRLAIESKVKPIIYTNLRVEISINGIVVRPLSVQVSRQLFILVLVVIIVGKRVRWQGSVRSPGADDHRLVAFH